MNLFTFRHSKQKKLILMQETDSAQSVRSQVDNKYDPETSNTTSLKQVKRDKCGMIIRGGPVKQNGIPLLLMSVVYSKTNTPALESLP
jgi:hypothetical protein